MAQEGISEAVTYLSQRMREIREEEARRRGEADPIPIESVAIGRIKASDLVYVPWKFARDPHVREHISFKGRAG